jgi:hypothetical protein
MPRVDLPRAFLGIDPGIKGGLAVVHERGYVLELTKMPQTERDVWEWVSMASHISSYAMIENVHSMPEQGIVGAFTFGRGYGGLRMGLIAAGIPFEEITPQSWVKGIGITKRNSKTESKTVWKNRLKARAQQLFPGIKITLFTSDAILIAEYCRRRHLGLLKR